MHISRRLLLSVVVALMGVGSLAFALSASAERAHSRQEAGFLSSSVAPSIPAGPTIHGVGPGTLPWALGEGNVRLRADGRFELGLDGLVLTNAPFTGTPGPVTGIAAAVFCGPDSNTTPAATTGVVPLSNEGNASIETTLALPSTCVAPIVLVNPLVGGALVTARYIAVTGFTR